jgi:hypothetical protein
MQVLWAVADTVTAGYSRHRLRLVLVLTFAGSAGRGL